MRWMGMILRVLASALVATLVQATLPLLWRMPGWWHAWVRRRFGQTIVRFRVADDQVVYVWRREEDASY